MARPSAVAAGTLGERVCDVHRDGIGRSDGVDGMFSRDLVLDSNGVAESKS